MTRVFAGIGTCAVGAVLATAIAAGMQSVKPVTIPRGDGAPVITDGVFTAGEWDDALKIMVNDGVTLYLSEGKPGMVTCPPAAAERVTDAWLELRLQ